MVANTPFVCGPTKFCKGNSAISINWYGDGTPALVLIDPETNTKNMTATVNMSATEDRPPPHHVYIKDWSENEGVLDALIKSGLVEKTGTVARAGFCVAHLVKLKPQLAEYL